MLCTELSLLPTTLLSSAANPRNGVKPYCPVVSSLLPRVNLDILMPAVVCPEEMPPLKGKLDWSWRQGETVGVSED